MLDDQELRRMIVKLLATEGRANGDVELAPQTSLTDGGLELTSLELVRLLVNLEEHLDIELDDGEIMNAQFDTVDDIVTLVTGSLSRSERAGAHVGS